MRRFAFAVALLACSTTAHAQGYGMYRQHGLVRGYGPGSYHDVRRAGDFWIYYVQPGWAGGIYFPGGWTMSPINPLGGPPDLLRGFNEPPELRRGRGIF